MKQKITSLSIKHSVFHSRCHVIHVTTCQPHHRHTTVCAHVNVVFAQQVQALLLS